MISMKACRHCGSDLAGEHQFCPQCGQPWDEAPAAEKSGIGSDRTTKLSQAGLLLRRPAPVDVFASRAGTPYRSLAVDDLFAARDRLVIGRAESCDLCLPHSSVSRVHALLERRPEGI